MYYNKGILVVHAPTRKHPIIWNPSWHNALDLIILLLRVLIAFAFRAQGALLPKFYLKINTREIREHFCDFRAAPRD